MTNYSISVKELAEVLNITTRQVQRLAVKEILPKPTSKGQYDFSECVKKYLHYLLDASNDKSIDVKLEKAKLIRAQATKADLEAQSLLSKLVPTDEVEHMWQDLILHFRAKILAMPTKLARPLAALNSNVHDIEDLLEEELHAALRELSKYDGKESQQKLSAASTKA